MASRERIGLLLAAALACAVFAFAPSATYSANSFGIVENLVRGNFIMPHPGYLPLGALVRAATDSTPERSLRLVSAVGGALLVSGTYLGLRRLGYSIGPSACGALLAGLAPASLFFSRHIEVRSLHSGAAAVAFAAFAGTGYRGVRGLGAPSMAAAVLVTHATGALSIPFLAWLGASRRGTGARAPVLKRVGLGILLAAAFVLVLSALQAVLNPRPANTPPLPTPVHSALYQFFWLAGGAERHGVADYLLQALLLPSGLLALAAVPGFVALALRRSRPGLALAAWIGAYLVLGAGWGYEERGAYLLPVYPALAAGAAETATLLVRRSSGGSLARTAGRGFPVLLVAAQAAIGFSRGVAPSLGPDPLRWVEAARAATDDRGWLVTMEIAHASLVRRYTHLQVLAPTVLVFRPREEWSGLLEILAAEAARQALAGEAVYVDQDVPHEVLASKEFGDFFDRIRSRADLIDASRRPFRAWRVVPRG